MSVLQIELPQEKNLDHILPDLRHLAVDIDILLPDPENARKHDPRNIKMIAESFLRFGQRTPFTANRKTNYVQKGNGGYMAAKLIGWRWVAVAWTDDERKESIAYGIIDNRTSDTSTNDYSQTGKHLRELQSVNYEMSQFWSSEEMMPLVRGEFVKPEITDEVFDPGLQRGRAISKISASERIVVDKAVAFVRSQSKKPLTEGAALELICSEFMSYHIIEVDNNMQQTMETAAAATALSLDDEE